MHIILVGVNYRSAPIDVRERLAFRPEHLSDVFARLRHDIGLREAAILSTCNRVEVYAAAEVWDPTVGRLQQFLSDHSGVALDGLVPRLYRCKEPESVHHLFAVASGIDSMVLGESEIAHQVKHAYEWARDHGATGKAFNVLFQRALNTAKAVRTQTAIARGSLSVGAVAVELAEKVFGELQRSSVVLIGAGKIGELTLRRLADRGVRDVRVVNRSTDRSAELSKRYQARAIGLERLAQQLLETDIIISSTSAPGVILRRDHVAAAMRARHQRPLCLIDLGVPRNIEPTVGGLENVYLFNIDDLEGLVEHSRRGRQEALGASRTIIDCKVERFLSWWHEEHVGCVPSSLGPVAVP